MGLATHITFRAVDSRVLAPSVGARRALASAVHTVGDRYGLLAFGAADTHVHVLLALPSAAAGPASHALALAVRGATGVDVALEPARRTDVGTHAHLVNTFFYVLNQPRHHGVASDPWLDATSTQDLLGMRPGSVALRARVREMLPRVRVVDLLRPFGRAELTPIFAADGLVDAAAAAAGAPDLRGRSRRVLWARQAALHLAAGRIGSAAAARVLDCPERTARRDRALAADPTWVRAVELQMALRSGPQGAAA